MSRIVKFKPVAINKQTETQSHWCRCRITEPAIIQRGDSLQCNFCGCIKELRPRANLKWERLKKQLLTGGRDEYKSYAKDALIEMLLKRDKMLLEDLQIAHLKGERRLHPDTIQERIVAQVPYIVFSQKK